MRKMRTYLLAAIAVMGLTMCSEKKQTAEVVEEPVDSCAVMAEFPGGQDAMVAFMTENITYPKQAEEVGMEGRVVCTFVVEKDGTIGDVQVVESVDSLLDAEAVRVLNSMPTWTPGQNEAGEAVRVKYTIPISFTLDGTRDDIDEMPEFPGGMDACMKFMIDNLKYPSECEKNGIQGRVLIQAVVDEKGNVTEAVVKKSIDPLLDAEALRVVKMMPKWKPGMNNGQAVKVNYTIPVTFALK